MKIIHITTKQLFYNLTQYLKIFLIINLLLSSILLSNLYAYKEETVDYNKLKDINKIPLEEKIGQMLMIGIEGYTLNRETTKYIRKYHIGGVILFDTSVNKKRIPNIKNKEQVKELTSSLQKISKIPLFIAVDNEGGKVTKLKAKDGFFAIPSQQDLAKMGEKATYKYSKKMAQELKELGININFAPVVDLNLNPKNPIIGALGRSFSSNPKVVAQMAKAYIEGQNTVGIITSLKHFPGHGSSSADSHLGMVDITKTWQRQELFPYNCLIKHNNYNQMVMVAHVINKNLDKNNPASLSKAIMTDLLRNKLKFKGVVITDSLDMDAIYDHYSYKNVLIKAINAGADILLNANNNKRPFEPKLAAKSVKIIAKAVNNGEIPEQTINNAYLRIIQLKEEFRLKHLV